MNTTYCTFKTVFKSKLATFAHTFEDSFAHKHYNLLNTLTNKLEKQKAFSSLFHKYIEFLSKNHWQLYSSNAEMNIYI